MKPLAEVVVYSGLVPDPVLDELARWGFHVTAKPDADGVSDAESVVDNIRNALEGSEQVTISETDLDLLRHYLDPKFRREGKLILKEDKRQTTVKVNFCYTTAGEVAIPWTDEDTPDVLFNGETYLRYTDSEGQHDIYFAGAREYFFGRKKAFAVCTIYEKKK